MSTKHPITPFVNPHRVLNLTIQNVFYVQSAFTYYPGSTIHIDIYLPWCLLYLVLFTPYKYWPIVWCLVSKTCWVRLYSSREAGNGSLTKDINHRSDHRLCRYLFLYLSHSVYLLIRHETFFTDVFVIALILYLEAELLFCPPELEFSNIWKTLKKISILSSNQVAAEK